MEIYIFGLVLLFRHLSVCATDTGTINVTVY